MSSNFAHQIGFEYGTPETNPSVKKTHFFRAKRMMGAMRETSTALKSEQFTILGGPAETQGQAGGLLMPFF
jgi:hypothetical protein